MLQFGKSFVFGELILAGNCGFWLGFEEMYFRGIDGLQIKRFCSIPCNAQHCCPLSIVVYES